MFRERSSGCGCHCPGRPRIVALLAAILGSLQRVGATWEPEPVICNNKTVGENDTSWLRYITKSEVDDPNSFGEASYYIVLPEIDNWSRNGGLETVWSKLRLMNMPWVGDESVIIDMQDFYFSNSSGTSSSGELRMEWGIAGDCRGEDEVGAMRINLHGIPLLYEPPLPTSVGFQHFGKVVCDGVDQNTSQNCSASCGGSCGFCGSGLPGNVTTLELKVTDHCLFDAAVLANIGGNTTTVVTTTTTSKTETSSTVTSSTTSMTTTASTTLSSSTATSTSQTITNTTTITSSTTLDPKTIFHRLTDVLEVFEAQDLINSDCSSPHHLGILQKVLLDFTNLVLVAMPTVGRPSAALCFQHVSQVGSPKAQLLHPFG